MDSQQCLFCDESANILCECKNPPIFLCKAHIQDHLSHQASHSLLNPAKGTYMVIEPQQSFMKERINFIKLESLRLKTKIINKTNKILKNIQDNSNFIIEELNYLESLCSTLTTEIDSLHEIPSKLFYSPLESYIFFSKPLDLLNNLIPPAISFKKYHHLISISNLFSVFSK